MNLIIRIIFVYTLVCLVSCSENNMFTLNGTLSNKKEKHIYVIYDDPIAKVDTIKPENGKFEYTFLPDTITIFRLVNDSGIAIPVFADKGWKVTFKGSFANPDISGDGPNNELQQFRNLIHKDTANIVDAAKNFILKNRMSYASAYVFNQYFVQGKKHDYKELSDIITQMDGHVKDCRVVDIIQKTLSENSDKSSEYLNYFSCKDRKGKYVSWSSKEEQYTLVNIWASWDETSNRMRDSLYNVVKSLPEKEFRILNISIDLDKSEWEKKCKEENEQWIETCDLNGWQNQIVKQMNISKVPYNILVNKNRKIITSNIYGEELTRKVKNLIQENKNKK